MNNTNISKCLIIGSGPAGYTAAIYAARAALSPIMLTGMEQGGQLTTTTEVENYPGFPNGITGPELMEFFKNQALRFETKIIFDTANKVSFSLEKGMPHKIFTTSGSEYLSHTVIISTGATAKYLGMDCEKNFMGAGVSACATCDGFFYKGKEVVVIGGGDTAAEEASYLANLCKKVSLVVRKNNMRASKAMQQRISRLSNVEILWNSELHNIKGNKVVETVEIINNQTQQIHSICAEGVFIAIGHQPNTHIFKDFLDMDDTGYLITKANTTLTNIAGVFAAGDCQDKNYRQAVTAAGSGCMAALDAERYFNSLFNK